MTTFSIKPNKSARVQSYDWDTLPESSRFGVSHYGFTQFLQDGYAGVQRKDYDSDETYQADVEAAVDKRDAMIRNGTMPGVRAIIDPDAASAAKMGVSVEVYREILAAGMAARAAAAVETPKKSRAA